MSNKKNLLIYAHYYIPDAASTGQILRELAEGMLDTKVSLRIDCCCNLYTGLLSCNEIAGDLTREEKKNYDGK